VQAGLVTEARARTSDPGDPLISTVRVVTNLVEQGLDERELAGFFVTQGFGPMLQSAELSRADQSLVRCLSATDAHELCALPIRWSPAGAVVAMADPKDERALAKLRVALGGEILPTVAKVSDLVDAIDRAYPPDRPTLVSDLSALARSRAPSAVMPLVQAKSEPRDSDPSLAELTKSMSPAWDRAWNRSATDRQVSVTPKWTHVPLPSVEPTPGQTSASFETPAPPSTSDSSVASKTVVPPTVSDSASDAHLAELRRANDRDEVVRVACQACLSVARGAAFLALRKGVFRGWDGAGEDVTSAGIRSLWVPATNPSVLSDVLHSGRVFRGAYGETAADYLFRGAFGSHGRDVVIVPVIIGSRMVGVLCANDPVGDASAVERVAEAMGQAFERLIVSQKTEG
jgi:hypothetical protein